MKEHTKRTPVLVICLLLFAIISAAAAVAQNHPYFAPVVAEAEVPSSYTSIEKLMYDRVLRRAQTLSAMQREVSEEPKNDDVPPNGTIVAVEGMDTFDQRNEAMQYFADEVSYVGVDYNKTFVHDVTSKYTRGMYSRPVGYTIQVDEPSIVMISPIDNADKAPITEYVQEPGEFTVYNLVPYITYEWNIISADHPEVVKTGYVMATGNIRTIWTDTVANARDLGGWDANGGTVRYGKLFRGGPLAGNTLVMSAADQKTFWQLGIKTEVDLRSYGEVNGPDGKSGTDDDYTYCPVDGIEYYLMPSSNYKSAVTIGTAAAKRTAEILKFIMSEVVNNRPVYFHCAYGADRTGTIAFMLEGILGVPQDQLDKDYELTSFGYRGGGKYRSGDYYRGMLYYMQSIEGETLEDKFITWYLKMGFTEDELNAFREAAIMGTPEPINISNS